MADFPKLIVFSDSAIPRVKSTYKGATVETFNFGKLDTYENIAPIYFLRLCKSLGRPKHKRVTVFSNYTDVQLTFFNMSNTSYLTVTIESEADYKLAIQLNMAFDYLWGRHDSMEKMKRFTNGVDLIFDEMKIATFQNIMRKHDKNVEVATNITKEIESKLKDKFFETFKFKAP